MVEPSAQERPANLEPSKLGTKDYWDQYYQNDLDGGELDDDIADPSQLESWFDDVNAPEKVLEYLTSDVFPLSPNNTSRILASPSILDLGTGNGSTLFRLRMEGGYDSSVMVGVDYSQQSIDLARRFWKGYISTQETDESSVALMEKDIVFHKFDLLQDDPRTTPWWHKKGFDLVLDKGTFDAISLSSETITDEHGTERRIHELYPAKVADLISPGGYFVITSCNWTEAEILRWFTEGEGVESVLEEFGRVRYPVYEFGGQKGQGVASVCFRKVSS